MYEHGILKYRIFGTSRFAEISVPIKSEAPDKWFAWYEGKWRKVHVRLRGLHIICDGVKISMFIDGV